MSNGLDPDQNRKNASPDLGPSCLQSISADNTSRQRVLTLCILETPKQVLLQTVKCSIMLHFIRVYTVCKGEKDNQTIKTIFFENYNLTPLDMYNGLLQVYCIKQEGIIHLIVYKGLKIRKVIYQP